MTNLVPLQKNNFAATVAQAAEILRRGGVIAYPTETLYGLGALATSREGVDRVRKIKGKNEPMLVLVSGIEMAQKYARVDDRAVKLIKIFWPGPLTLIFSTDMDILAHVRGPSSGIGMRSSSDKFARELVISAGGPVISTSANRSGSAPLETGKAIEQELGPELDLIVDDGPRSGMPSTVVDLTGPDLKIVREGALKSEEIRKVVK
jgi:L-threonylcarbamoyladenylate synthase